RRDIGFPAELQRRFQLRFRHLSTTFGQPRDLVLRGRFRAAARELVEQHTYWRNARELREDPVLDREIDDWVAQARSADASMLRARGQGDPAAQAEALKQYKAVWKEDQPIHRLLLGALSEPMGAAVGYQLGLCKQEQAERLQARLDREEGPSAAALQKAQD